MTRSSSLNTTRRSHLHPNHSIQRPYQTSPRKFPCIFKVNLLNLQVKNHQEILKKPQTLVNSPIQQSSSTQSQQCYKCFEALQAIFCLAHPTVCCCNHKFLLYKISLLHVPQFPLTIQPKDHSIFMFTLDLDISLQLELDLQHSIDTIILLQNPFHIFANSRLI